MHAGCASKASKAWCGLQAFRGIWRMQPGSSGPGSCRLSYALFVRPQVSKPPPLHLHHYMTCVIYHCGHLRVVMISADFLDMSSTCAHALGTSLNTFC